MSGSGVPWPYRYVYLSGGVTGGGWETYNSPAGAYAGYYMSDSASVNAIPVFSYYEMCQSTGPNGNISACYANNQKQDIANINDPTVMTDYFTNFKLLLDQVKKSGKPAIIHVEPDLWGMLESGSTPASGVSAKVKTSGYGDAAVTGTADTVQGFACSLLRLRDAYAPNAIMAIHASPWSSGIDLSTDKNPSTNAVTEADKTAAFLNSSCLASNPFGGSTWDLVFNDLDDHDAGWWEQNGSSAHWWDPNNVQLPTFNRYLSWVAELKSKTSRPQIAWQVPVGNQYYETMNNTCGHYQDNVAQYFVSHPLDLYNAGLIAVLFGAGNSCQTNNTDAMGDGITNSAPTADAAGFCSTACNTHASTVSDDDGGFLRNIVGAYEKSVAAACKSTAISTDLTSPQIAGTTVTMSATSAGCPDLNPLYRFWLRSPEGVWSIVKDFSTSSSFAWDTSSYEKGTYLTGVWAKDASSFNSYDAYAYGTFTIQVPGCSSTNLASDVASPQAVGTTVNFTASSVGCPSPQYQWWVRDAAGNWSIAPGRDFAHSSSTFAWNTAALTDGTYQIGVWARQAHSTASYDAFAFVTYTLTVSHCTSVNLTTDLSSPRTAGATIVLTAVAAGCTNPQYRFYVRDAAGTWNIVHDFSSAATYSWGPGLPVRTSNPGTYLLGVWARQPGSANSYDAFFFVTFSLTSGATCTVSLGADRTSPQSLGTTVNWTATAGSCLSGPLQYQFWVNPPGGTWAIVQPFSATNTFAETETGAGTYQVGVWIKQAGSTSAYDNFAFSTSTLAPTVPTCTWVNAGAGPASPQLVGTGVTLSVTGVGNCGNPEYRWWVRDTSASWAIKQDYTVGGATFNWSTGGLAPGTYLVGVWARESGSAASYEAYSFITYTLTVPAPQVCTSVNIAPSPPSPQVHGTSITFTATSTGCSSPTYRFFVAPPGGSFAEVRPYGANTYVWTTGSSAGPWQVGVWARQSGSGASYEAFAFVTFQLS